MKEGKKMERVSKTIEVTGGLLFAITGTKRYQIAECEADIIKKYMPPIGGRKRYC